MLAGIISTWTAACGGDDHVVVVLDGARFPLKAREHARRGITSASREQLLADAIQLDEEDKSAEADAKYKELSYPVPPSVDAWLVAHCMAFGVPLIVAPFEADSQCAALARSGAGALGAAAAAQAQGCQGPDSQNREGGAHAADSRRRRRRRR